ncbi:TetR/AcrR family transcriptional regulator [Actinomycetospora straminea]|uniref:HTH-type transcriptional regulator MT1864/Rv1816-like C-terminal domain-containing protein n=1 Tax=Actinomycetospora straminea TaxID=663607 RepID=A0ABP9EI52_9PSEU|nr:TetR/AcrR family transcriptional regulator [Actinomycetospora straminea]MDD7936396.1 TetR/AcrR family transcriptional regulator [Actinomycetospora straminea]
MARQKDPAVRTQLLERAARMLREREPITLRSLVAGTGVSTMAVYTYFGGMDGVWRALRQEGFTRLAARLDALVVPADPVEDLVAGTAAYAVNALEHPDLYRVMFDATVELEDVAAAEATLGYLERAARRCLEEGRIAPDADPDRLATEVWTVCHGIVSLVVSRVASRRTLASGVPLLTAVIVAAGDDPAACRRSVEAGWAALRPTRDSSTQGRAQDSTATASTSTR